MFNKEIKPYKTHDNKLRLDFEGYCLTLKRGKLDAIWCPERYGIITWRSFTEYAVVYPELKDSSILYKQVFEVGPGLGECLPVLCEYSARPPFACDPTDYRSIIKLLSDAKRTEVGPDTGALLDTLIGRAELMMSSKVQLFSMSLEKAFQLYGNKLDGVADVVIDLAGATHNSPDKDEVKGLEKRLLRNNPI
jgi:hypothetical protein